MKVTTRIQIVTTLPQELTVGGMMKQKSGWDDVGGHEVHENPIAKAMLHGWCCGYNLDQQDGFETRSTVRD